MSGITSMFGSPATQAPPAPAGSQAFNLARTGNLLGGIGSAFTQSQAIRQHGEAAARAHEYNAAVARNNSTVASQYANNELLSTASDVGQQLRVNEARFGKLKTQILKSGVALEGTPMLLLAEEAAQNQFEANKMEYAGKLRAHQLQQRAADFQNQANMDVFQAQSSRYQANKKATPTLLSGLSKSFSIFNGSS